MCASRSARSANATRISGWGPLSRPLAAAPLLLLALAGCWSHRLNDFEVFVDDPGAVGIAVVTDTSSDVGLAPGDGDGAGSVAVEGRTISFTRTSAGVRVACETCGPTQMLVGADGRFVGLYQHREIDLVIGEPVVARRPYDLARIADMGPRVTLELGADWSRVRRVEAMQKPNRALGWTAFGVGLFGVLPSLLLLGEKMYWESAVVAGATTFLLGWGGHVAFHGRRAVIVWEPGDTRFEPRPIED